jgi:hypothetical protein
VTKAYYNDTIFENAVHLDIEEAELLRDFHFKNIAKLESKVEKIIDKADGSTKYDEIIGNLYYQISYSKNSFDEALRIMRFYSKTENK